MYNSTSVMYFLNWLQRYKTIPKHLTDLNLKTDISWVRRLTASNPQLTEEFVDRLAVHGSIRYDDVMLMEKFNMQQFFEKGFFPISFFYLGMLTRKDEYFLQLPNLNMRRIFTEYFNEIHRIDVSTRYTEFMQAFSNKPELEPLFAGYWQEYVSQLPEAIFQQVNENFYRTTFYELCSRYLSRWFTWHVERSYPQGRSDLEFVGKYNEIYAGLRWVIEFKYFSNNEFKKFKTSIADFQLRSQDTEQIAGYAEGLRQEYPEARIALFVIYCFGNQGFRVIEVQ
ncbi:AAA family ATPase [Candidatus Electrothrix aarhusensis]